MFDDTLDFPKAIAEERGCGEREPGGCYVESGLSPHGAALEYFMFDPPLPVPDGLDLVNKTQLWQRRSATGEPVLDALELPIYDLLIHVGAQHYPWAPDYIEETRRLGASRKLNPTLDLAHLSRESRMLLVHPKAIPLNWQELLPPQVCKKDLPRHDLESYEALMMKPLEDEQRTGPCLFKLWELIPQKEATAVIEQPGERPLCLRQSGSTIYHFSPTGETVAQWEPGFILALPVTGFALIRFEDGSVNARAKEKVLAGREAYGNQALPFYETDR